MVHRVEQIPVPHGIQVLRGTTKQKKQCLFLWLRVAIVHTGMLLSGPQEWIGREDSSISRYLRSRSLIGSFIEGIPETTKERMLNR